MKDSKNYVNNLLKITQADSTVDNKVSSVWYDKFLEYITKAATKGFNISKKIINKLGGTENLSEGHLVDDAVDFVVNSKAPAGLLSASLWAGQVVFGIISAVILVAIGLWMTATGKIVTKLSGKPGILEKLKRKFNKYFGNEESDLPDDLAPPDINVPNLDANLSESLSQYMKDEFKKNTITVIVKFCLVLFLKSILSGYFVWWAATAIAVGIVFFLPGINLITYLLVWILLGLITLLKKFSNVVFEDDLDADDF